MSRRRQRPLLTVMGLALLLSGCALQQNVAFAPPNTAVGTKAPPLNGTTIDGQRLSVTFQGHKTILLFWASWCGPCRHEQPGLNRLASEFTAQGVSFYGVDFLDHDRSQAKAFVQEFHVSYPSIYDDPGQLAAAFGVDAPPSQVLIDQRGIIVGRVPGEISEEKLRALIVQKLVPH